MEKDCAVKEKTLISVIVPCYCEEQVLLPFHAEICRVSAGMPQYDFEFIFVDDGSKDKTLEIIKQLCAADCRVRFISFSRNFGKESAMYAGLKAARGEYTAVMDADLQDPPALLGEMCSLLESGEYDCVATKRVTRKGEPPIRSFFARCFYRLINKISETEIVDGARDYRLMTRRMVDSILELGEYGRFSKGIFSWVGFKTKWLEFENIQRAAGETKWSFWKLFLYSIDGIVAFSTAPLALASVLGIFCCFAAFLGIIFVFIRELIWQGSAYGWASLVCIVLLLGGLILLCLGIQGQYIAKTYMETKKRPLYIVKESSEESDCKKTTKD